MMFSTKPMTQRNDLTPQKPTSANRDDVVAQMVKRDGEYYLNKCFYKC